MGTSFERFWHDRKLVGHSMFQGEGQLKRLQMCADCRVVDMMSNKREASVLRLGADS